MPSWRSKNGWLFSEDSFASCQIDARKCGEPKHSALLLWRSGSAQRSGGVLVRSLEGLHFSNYEFSVLLRKLSRLFFGKFGNLPSPFKPIGLAFPFGTRSKIYGRKLLAQIQQSLFD
jgi:hypothetical protein